MALVSTFAEGGSTTKGAEARPILPGSLVNASMVDQQVSAIVIIAIGMARPKTVSPADSRRVSESRAPSTSAAGRWTSRLSRAISDRCPRGGLGRTAATGESRPAHQAGMTVATATVIISFLISVVVVRSKFWGRKLLDQLAFLPHAVPGMVMGLAATAGKLCAALAVKGNFVFGSVDFQRRQIQMVLVLPDFGIQLIDALVQQILLSFLLCDPLCVLRFRGS